MHHADSLEWPDPKCSICSMRYLTSTSVSGVGSLRPLPVRHSTITGPPTMSRRPSGRVCGLAFLTTVPTLPTDLMFSCVFVVFWQLLLSLCFRSGGWRCGGLWISAGTAAAAAPWGATRQLNCLHASCQRFPASAVDRALLWLTPDKPGPKCRSHSWQVWLKKTISTCIQLWSLCRGAPGAPERKEKKRNTGTAEPVATGCILACSLSQLT